MKQLILLVFLLAPLVANAGPESASSAFHLEQHRGLTLAFETSGKIVAQKSWPEIATPRKFSLKLDVEAGGTLLEIMLFKLDGRGGDWWLSRVMGFLFDPLTEVQSFLTRSGQEAFYIDIPGGGGVFPQREALVLFPNAAVRITCVRCIETGADVELDRLIDSMSVF